ncbi:MAG: DUF4886 domain-containing protein [Clostridiales bacterium]|nr:DUF4886 domain-containing protein [Clostridiales bacterium]
MKRAVSLLLLLALLLTGCAGGQADSSASTDNSGDSSAQPVVFAAESSAQEAEPEEKPDEGSLYRLAAADPDTLLKILVVGNSFSVDSSEFLYEVATDAGYQVLVGNLNRSSTPLADHWGFAKNDEAVYTYRKNGDGSWETLAKKNATMSEALEDEDWDIILFQQQSYQAGVASTYRHGETSYVTQLADFAREHCSNEAVKIGWQMTWSLRECTERYYVKRFTGELDLYEKICAAVQTEVEDIDAADFIIATGTAIQNARSSYLGDTLDRDGKHLSYDLGRYLAAMSVASACGMDLSGVDKLDTSVSSKSQTTLSTLHLPLLCQCVADSEQTPYAITQQSETAPALEQTTLTVAAAENGQTLTWTAVEGATGYEVTDGNDEVLAVLDVETTTYTVEAGTGRTKYRVAALGDDYLASASSPWVNGEG